MQDLLKKCIALAVKAGDAVMEVYESHEHHVEIKSDDSPVTKADKLANQIIEDGLKSFSDFPIISEEGKHEAEGDFIWLVDPIDGTKEFISRNGEFTINIGLVNGGEPILGVVYAPAKKVLYYAAKNLGAFKQAKGQVQKIKASYNGKVPTVVISRSHLSGETNKFLDKLGKHKIIVSGSSLKLCLVAEGAVSFYPRFSPTHLWDTAAGDAIVREAGGQVRDLNNKPLNYDPSQILNPSFVAGANS